ARLGSVRAVRGAGGPGAEQGEPHAGSSQYLSELAAAVRLGLPIGALDRVEQGVAAEVKDVGALPHDIVQCRFGRGPWSRRGRSWDWSIPRSRSLEFLAAATRFL